MISRIRGNWSGLRMWMVNDDQQDERKLKWNFYTVQKALGMRVWTIMAWTRIPHNRHVNAKESLNKMVQCVCPLREDSYIYSPGQGPCTFWVFTLPTAVSLVILLFHKGLVFKNYVTKHMCKFTPLWDQGTSKVLKLLGEINSIIVV